MIFWYDKTKTKMSLISKFPTLTGVQNRYTILYILVVFKMSIHMVINRSKVKFEL